MNNLRLSEIWIYPIKSLGGISISTTKVEKRGLEYDRRWMLVDENGVFLSQRKYKEMALLKVEIIKDGLRVRHKIDSTKSIFIPFDATPVEYLTVQIWDDECRAYTISQQINNWFTSVLGVKCQLVYMPNDSYRQVDIRYASKGDINNFSDGFPILIIGQKALDKLNDKLAKAIPMNRFRPNLVFVGGQANEEDKWKVFKIGESSFVGAKPCARCIMTTINQDNGQAGSEPLKTLATYRKVGNKILFGQNVIARDFGQIISVGDRIEIVKY